MKRLVLGVLLLILLAVGVSASGDFGVYEWGSPNTCDTHKTAFSDGIGYWHNNFAVETDTLAGGLELQPLALDLDNDDNTELVTATGSSIQIWGFDPVTFTIILEEQLSVTDPVEVQFTAYNDYDENGYPEIVVVNDDGIHVIEYSGTAYVIKDDITGPTVDDPETGIACGSCSNSEQCVYGSLTDVCVYDLNDDTILCTAVAGATSGVFDTDYGHRFSPAIGDFDKDSVVEAVFVADNNSNDDEGLLVWNINASALDTGFSNDGVLDDLNTCDQYMAGFLVYDLQGVGGQEEILFTCMSNTSTWIRAYDSSGSITAYNHENACGEACITNHVISQPARIPYYTDLYTGVNGNKTGTFICYANSKLDTPTYEIICIQDTNIFEESSSDKVLVTNTTQNIVTGRLLFLNSTTDYYTVIGNNIITSFGNAQDQNDNFTVLDYDTDDRSGYDVILADVNNDNNLDICGMTYGSVFCSFPNFANTNAEFNTRDIGRNFGCDSPVCVGTTVTFTATQCGSEPCHYTNENSNDKERLVANCGNQTELINGTYHLTKPTLGCSYDEVGNYVFDVYLQDESNDDVLTEYQSVSIYVMNGTAGVDCNLPISSDCLNGDNNTVVSADDELTSEDDITYFVETLTGQSDFINYFLVIIITLGLVATFVKMGIKSPVIIGMVLFATWIICALLGLIAWIYVILFAVVIVAGTVLMFIFGRENGGSE